MVDLNEIFNSLEDERTAHFLNPAIICGLGDRGREIVRRLRRRLDALPGLADQDILYFADFYHQANKANAKLSIDDRRGRIVLKDRGETRAALSRSLAANGAAIGAFWRRTAGNLLDRAGNLSQVEATRLNIIFVGDIQDRGSSVGAIDLARMARDYLTGFIVNLDLELSGLFLLPKGVSEQDAEVYAFLTDLTGEKTNFSSFPFPLSPLYDRSFLVSPTNGSGILDETATLDLAAEFLLLALTDSKASIDRLFPHEPGTLATFGLSSLVYPAAEVTEHEAKQFAADLIECEFLKEGDSFYERLASDFIGESRFSVDDIKERLADSGDRALSERIDLDPLYFQQVEMGHWPDRIASYDAFLESEKTGELLGRLEHNLVRTYAQSRAALRHKVNELLGADPSIEGVRRFLLELRTRLGDLHNQALRRQDEILRSLPSLKERHEDLTHQVKNLPSLAALVSRLTVFAVVTVYLLTRALLILRQIPPRYFNVKFLPSDETAVSVAIFLIAALGWLFYRRAETRLFRARGRYLAAVEERHRYIINWWIQRDVTWLFGDAKAPELVQRHIGSLVGLVDDELDAVDRIRRVYLQTLGEFKESAVDFPRSKVRRPITDALGVTMEIKYKRGHFNLPEEAALFLAGGAHQDWRNMSMEDLKCSLLAYVAKGFKYARVSGAQRVIADLATDGADFDRALVELKRFSMPYLPLSPAAANTIEMLATASPANINWLGGRDLGSALPIGSVDRNSIYYLQLAHISLESIASLTAWRRAYESLIDKSEHHCVKIDGMGLREGAGG